MNEYLECVELGPQDADATVIWLHGLGADGHDFEPIVPELRLPQDLKIRFLFPHAPIRPVTLNNGYPMRAWFDIHGLGLDADFDREQFEDILAEIEKLIRRETQRGVAEERIVLAGFSMGGAVALGAGLGRAGKLAGMMGLSTFLFDTPKAKIEFRQPKDTPVFMAHGGYDDIVPITSGESTYRRIEAAGYAPEWHTYPMPHSVCAEEIAAIRSWLLKLF